MDVTEGKNGEISKPPTRKKKEKSPFKNGWVPTHRHRGGVQTFITRKGLLKHMLEMDITVDNLPIHMSEKIREVLPGWFDDVERRFTMRQIMELVQFQLLFSNSDHVRQEAINSIKDRVDGKVIQKLQFEDTVPEETEILLPNGNRIII